jgi:uncharacterized membrane protein YjgN (DUF898 family)
MEPRPQTDPTVIFVLGLLGILMCQILGPIAWIMGNRYKAECAALGIAPDGLAVAGQVLGLVSTIFLIFGILVAALYLAFVFLLVGGALLAGP